MDAVASSTDWLKLIGQVLVVAGGLTGLVAFFLRYANPADTVERWVDEDREYRNELARELKGSRFGALYQHTLDTGLGWLDHRFGAPNSQDALGICIIIALYYAFAAFFLTWGIGGPGDIAGVALLPEAAGWKVRLPTSLFFVAGLPLAYGFGCWIGGHERRLKVRLRRRRGLRKRRFELAWRGMLVLLTSMILVGWCLAIANLLTANPVTLSGVAGRLALALVFPVDEGLMLGGLVAIGPAAGALVGWQMERSRFAQVLSALAAFGAVVGAYRVAAAVAAAVAGDAVDVTFAVATVALAVVTVVVASLVIAAAGGAAYVAAVGAAIIGIALASEYFAYVAGNTALSVTPAAAVAGAIGALNAQRWRRSVFAGGIGGITGMGLLEFWHGGGRDEAIVALLVLFLVLPLANGLSDWLSWWISRRLGRNLLHKLKPAASSWDRAYTIGLHVVADFVASVLLVAAMAYLLALGFAGYNQLTIALDAEGLGPFDLEAFLTRAAAAPWTNGLWLTVMLIATLVPTFLHLIMLLASPIALVALPTEKRLTLAADLETYAAQPERQASIRRRAGQYVAREKHGALALATFLLVLLLAALGWLVRLIHQGGLADYVLEVARAGVWTAHWVASLF